MVNLEDRFQAGAAAYAGYMKTTEGRLRLDIAWANVRDAVKGIDNETSPRALDVGGGTGALAVRLAREGWRVAVADSSAAMLALVAETAGAEDIAGRIETHLTDASEIAELFHTRSFELVICHNVLEYVADPAKIFHAMRAVARPRGLISVLVRNRAGEAMRAALKAHDLDEAAHALEAEWVRESLYGGPARLFEPDDLRALAADAVLNVVTERGVRVLADYLPAKLSDTADKYARLLDFELKLGARPDFAATARYIQLIARVA